MAVNPVLEPWITKNGEELPVQAMENSHLQNAIRVLSQWAGQEKRDEKKIELRDWVKVFKGELKRRERQAARELKRRGHEKPQLLLDRE